MSRVNHFHLPADDPQRAQDFYAAIFGWSFAQWGEMPFWLATTGDPAEPGINGGIYQREREGQGPSFVITVADIDAATAQVRAAGGTVNMARRAIPGVGWYASCRDTEGNVIGLMQADETAA
jgi:hypothetical protein